MKTKYKKVFLGLILIILVSSCEKSLDYTRYYNAKGIKGTEIYCWQDDTNNWQCGAYEGTDRLKTRKEIQFIQNELPCSLNTMKEILKTFNEDERKDSAVLYINYLANEVNTTTLDFTYYSAFEYADTYIFLYQQLDLNVPSFLYNYVKDNKQ